MNPYDILEISSDATKQQITAAFRQKAKECHPDLNPGDQCAKARFIQLQKAYEEAIARLSSPRHAAAEERSKPSRTVRNVRREVTITVPQSLQGVTMHLEGASGPCKGCRGEGHLRSNHPVQCSTCGGSGIAGYRERGIIRVKVACPDCAGSGRSTRIVCVECAGFGSMPSSALDVEIPPGCRDGDVLSVFGGASDPVRGIQGDLEIVVRVQECDGWRVVRDDVERDIVLPVWDAVLGAAVSVEGPDGRRFKLEIPPGSQPGRRFRLKGHGYAGAARRGDFVAVLAVSLPNPTDTRVQKAFERLRDDLA